MNGWTLLRTIRTARARIKTVAVLCTLAGCHSAALASAGQALPSVAWERHTIHAGPRGADGVDLRDVNGDGLLDATSAWEQSGVVTVSLHPRLAQSGQPWRTVTVNAAPLHGVEDAIFADVDADGAVDVISASENMRLTIHFAPTNPAQYLDPAAWTSTTITAATGLQRWMKVAFADIDGDYAGDIVAGGKTNPASIGWFRSPANPRDGSAWRYTVMSEVGWTMSIIPRDVDADGDPDIVMSDRQYITYPGGGRNYTLRGSRWLENSGAGQTWTNHPIGFSGMEHKFLHLADLDDDGTEDVIDGAGNAVSQVSTFRRNLGGWSSWQPYPIEQPQDVGRYLDVNSGDIDRDGKVDLVFSYSHATGQLSGVVWMRNLGSVFSPVWERNEISGAPGTKFDNVELLDVDGDGDLDAVTSEQTEQLGVVWYENPVVRE